MSAEYLLTSIVVILLPGTGVIYTLAYGLSKGWQASILAAFGCTLGILPHIAASIAGLAALLHTSALAFQVVKYLGVAYLLYMAWGILREGGSLEVSERSASVSGIKVIVNGFLLNILNPKLSLFFLAFLPQFVPRGGAQRDRLHAGAGGHLHGADLHRLRRLRGLCLGDPTLCDLEAQGHALAAARLCRSLRPAWPAPGSRRALSLTSASAARVSAGRDGLRILGTRSKHRAP